MCQMILLSLQINRRIQNMIFPTDFEHKIGFHSVRTLLKGRCLSSLGADWVDRISFLADVDAINNELELVREFRRVLEEGTFPDENFIDMRSSLVRIQVKGSYMDESELFALKQSLSTINNIITFFQGEAIDDDSQEDTSQKSYPALRRLTEEIGVFPVIVERIDKVLNRFGKIRDDASPELLRIRRSLADTKRQISVSLRGILHHAQTSGYAPEEASPTYRDGRLVIPVFPAYKKKIHGIVHDESATGKTVYMEPEEVVEANNAVRSLEAQEQRAIIAILQEISDFVRPDIPSVLESYVFLGKVDFIRAKALWANHIGGIEPQVLPHPMLCWLQACHPFLVESLRKRNKQMVPLDICLEGTDRILLISGPNAGGKSVTLTTVGLLQYMVQCGISVPVGEHSKIGIFQNIFLDIGDGQSIEDELSTYSGHLYNMKAMMKRAESSSLVLVNEMGGGTEPQIGAAIAQAILHKFLDNNVWGIVTTHYQNLKYYAQENAGIVNGAMLYDRAGMCPLFRLQIGMPGSSFAVEIANKIGLPQDVINEASAIVGTDYIQSDRYLQDIVRDKRYWEGKRQIIRQKEKRLDELIGRYEQDLGELSSKSKAVMREAQEKAASLIRESNAQIENTIRSIKEAQAEKLETRKARQQLDEFRQDIDGEGKGEDDIYARKAEQIRQRRLRHEQRKQEKASKAASQEKSLSPSISYDQGQRSVMPLALGMYVTIDGQEMVGQIEKIKGKTAVVVAGSVRLTVDIHRLAIAERPVAERPSRSFLTRSTQERISEKALNFKPSIDVRGMNGQEALTAVTYFVEDALLLNVSPLRILHGTGSGYLRDTIRQYLRSVPGVRKYHDEHVQMGGSGITIVEF